MAGATVGFFNLDSGLRMFGCGFRVQGVGGLGLWSPGFRVEGLSLR